MFVSFHLGRTKAITLLLITALIAAPISYRQASAQKITRGDWPQLAHDSQRTNATDEQVNPPYCYAWKWTGIPFASRAQPVISNGRLFLGGMDGVLYARNADTGAPLWEFSSGSPIRHSAAVYNNLVIFTNHLGVTTALQVDSGLPVWRHVTGPSATAPLVDPETGRGWVASTNGTLTALDLENGRAAWRFQADGAILTSPALSADGRLVFLGTENMQALAVLARTGKLVWSTFLEGQSLADRYPVSDGKLVYYRSQPLINFQVLLHAGDEILDSAGQVRPDWVSDWTGVRPKILDALGDQPGYQTFFSLDAATGKPSGLAPVLYTFGNQGIPAAPVVSSNGIYLPYRARHGIQTDGGSVHVTTAYDAELGRLDPITLDISAMEAAEPLSGPQFRLTSDEPAVLTMGGDILWVDNWERLGGINVVDGTLIHAANVSNTWPECAAECGPPGPRPFFPLRENEEAFPFDTPRVTEGNGLAGLVIANGMLYWRVIESGLAALTTGSGACPAARVWHESPGKAVLGVTSSIPAPERISISELIDTDLTLPASRPDPALVARLRSEVQGLLDQAGGDHLLPYYLERGMTNSALWPYSVPADKEPPALVTYGSWGNIFWHDPGELLLTLAMAYPYLDSDLQTRVRTYMQAEMERYPPLQDLPWNDPSRDWLRDGSPREPYQVSFRAELNSWPPPAANPSVLYALWLWSRNTNDWSYAKEHWEDIQAVFKAAETHGPAFYSDLAGWIGMVRLSDRLGKTSAARAARASAERAFRASQDFVRFQMNADQLYLDPRGEKSGWSAPVFYGLTPEVGFYLAANFNGQPQEYLANLESINEDGDGVVWWYITRAGLQGEQGETAYLAPTLAWSHFLAHAYILGDQQSSLRRYLDRPWAAGDLYSIQKITAALKAPR